MKKVKIIIIFSITFSLLFSYLGYYVYGLTYANNTHMMTYRDKIDYLSNIKGRKAVFVGGSGTHFGISSELFEKETNITSVNMGLHASISLNTYLNNIDKYLKNGDILFINPEYDYYCTSWRKYDGQNSEFNVLYSDTNLFNYFLESKDSLQNVIYKGWEEWSSILKQIISLKINGRTTDAYSRFDSNKQGDFINYKTNYVLSDDYTKYDNYDKKSTDELIKRIKEFENKGVKVYILFPPYIEYAYMDNMEMINNVEEYLQKNAIKLLYSTSDVAFSEEKFYDTVYHLNSDGKIIYTKIIINNFINENENK